MIPHNLKIPTGFSLDKACLARFPLTDYFLDESRRLGFGEDPTELAAFLLTNAYQINPPHKKGDDVLPLVPWVPGHGLAAQHYGPTRHHEIMVIGKMPYGIEAEKYANFIDASGQLLWETAREAGLDTTDWYLTNVMKFAQPRSEGGKKKGKGFDAWQLKVCIPLLMQEICLVQPKYLLMLGADAVKAVIGDQCTLGQVRSQPLTLDGLSSLREVHFRPMTAPDSVEVSSPDRVNGFAYFHAFATQHPAAVLREAGLRHGLVRDLQTFKTVMTSEISYSSVAERYQIEIVDNPKRLGEMVDMAIASGAVDISVDCEWGGNGYMSGRLRSVQFSWSDTQACVAVFLHCGGRPAQDEFDRIRMMNELRRLFNRPGLCISGHNIRADSPWLKTEGINILDGEFFDTMLADHMLNENAEHGLETCTVRYTDMGRYDFDMARWIKENQADVEANGFLNAPDGLLYPYAGCDVISTRRIKFKMQALLDLPENSGLRACYYGVVLPCNLPLGEIETTGLMVDFPLLKKMVWDYDTEKIKILERLRIMLADPDFNPNSPDQIKRVLFNRTPEQLIAIETAAQQGHELSAADQLVLEQLHPKEENDEEVDEVKEKMLACGTLQHYKPPRKKKEKCYRPGLGLTPYKTTGKPSVMWEDLDPSVSTLRRVSPSTDAESLAELSDKHAIVQVLADYKIVSQVTKAFLRKPDEDGDDPDDYTTGLGGAIDSDGRIRTNLSQMSETGRQKSYDPNLQNLPKKQEKELDRIFEGMMPHIRSCFVAPDGHVIIEADYKSAEIFSMGYLSNELQLVRDARTDLHGRGAVNYFGCEKWDGFDEGIKPPDAWLKQYKAERVGAKTINFGIPYQRGAKAVARQVTRETKGIIQCTKQMAQGWIDGFYFTYPGMREYVDMCKYCVNEPPYFLPNPYGRRRRFHQSNDRSVIAAMEREAVNFPIQSCVADTLNVALYNFWYWRKMWPGRAVYKILLAVHDAVLLEVPGEYVGVVVEEVIPQCMTGAAMVPSWQPTNFWQPTKSFQLETDIELCLRWGESPDRKKKGSIDQFANELKARNVPDKWINHFIEE